MVFKANHIIKLFTDAIGQDAFADFYGTSWEARKKEIQKLQKSEITEESFTRFINMLNDFTDWCIEKDYINTLDHSAVRDFIIPFIAAARFTPNNCIPVKDFIEYTTMYAVCFVFKVRMEAYSDFKDEVEPLGVNALIATLMQFNYWMSSNNYTNDISLMEDVFNLLFELVKDKRDLIEFWNSKKAEITDSDNPTDLNIQIKRWVNGKQRPTWKHIKLFLDEKLLLKESMIKNQINEEFSSEDLYLFFRRRIFPSCFITKFFDSLEKQDLIHEQSRNMIRNGIRLFYKRMLVDGGSDFSIEEKQNPMFCMMFRFLVLSDFGNHYNTDTAQYFKNIIF